MKLFVAASQWTLSACMQSFYMGHRKNTNQREPILTFIIESKFTYSTMVMCLLKRKDDPKTTKKSLEKEPEKRRTNFDKRNDITLKKSQNWNNFCILQYFSSFFVVVKIKLMEAEKIWDWSEKNKKSIRIIKRIT